MGVAATYAAPAAAPTTTRPSTIPIHFRSVFIGADSSPLPSLNPRIGCASLISSSLRRSAHGSTRRSPGSRPQAGPPLVACERKVAARAPAGHLHGPPGSGREALARRADVVRGQGQGLRHARRPPPRRAAPLG